MAIAQLVEQRFVVPLVEGSSPSGYPFVLKTSTKLAPKSRAMKLIKQEEQKTIQSDTCGSLIEVMNQEDFPFGIVLSEDITSTEAHYHRLAKKCYWVLEGWVEIVVEHVKTGERDELRLEEGDLITFEPFEKHEIVEGSVKNKLVTITSPAWHIEDVVKG